MPAMVGERSEEGFAALTLEGDARGGLEAVFVPEAGMVCCSLRHRGEELLGQRNGLRAYVDHYSTMGIPFLHPWANRLGADRFELAGRRVDLSLPGLPLKRDGAGLPIHGLLSAAPGWRVERHVELEGGGMLAASFDFGAYPHLLEAFPFPHLVEIEATLVEGSLEIATSVTATADVGVPIASASTPTCACPACRAPTGCWRRRSTSAWFSMVAVCRQGSASRPRSSPARPAGAPTTTPSSPPRPAPPSPSRVPTAASSCAWTAAIPSPRSTPPPTPTRSRSSR
jgi:hypothetical protein